MEASPPPQVIHWTVMDAEPRKVIRIILIGLLVLATARTAYIFYDRSKPGVPPPKPPTIALKDDDYVTPRKVFPYDLKSAVKELAGKTVWARTETPLPYYRYNSGTHSADLAHKAGFLPPLDKLEVKDVVLQRQPVAPVPGQIVVARKHIMAVFEKPAQAGAFVVSIGANVGEDFTFTVNEVFYFQDPHELYKHWPADVWNAIDRHEAKEGMNQLQVGFALGAPVASTGEDYLNRSIEYRSAGKPVSVTFVKDRAVKIVLGKLE
jgi:hypothetical protein